MLVVLLSEVVVERAKCRRSLNLIKVCKSHDDSIVVIVKRALGI
jgi:hypothetical protein